MNCVQDFRARLGNMVRLCLQNKQQTTQLQQVLQDLQVSKSHLISLLRATEVNNVHPKY